MTLEDSLVVRNTVCFCTSFSYQVVNFMCFLRELDMVLLPIYDTHSFFYNSVCIEAESGSSYFSTIWS